MRATLISRKGLINSQWYHTEATVSSRVLEKRSHIEMRAPPIVCFQAKEDWVFNLVGHWALLPTLSSKVFPVVSEMLHTVLFPPVQCAILWSSQQLWWFYISMYLLASLKSRCSVMVSSRAGDFPDELPDGHLILVHPVQPTLIISMKGNNLFWRLDKSQSFLSQ